jgi:Raf kinase inhibitor-like YbhB/YbcL family protein
MKIESPVFEDKQLIPSKYTCDGENINPPLIISGVPEGTKSMVLIIDDPDAPSGIWVHWTVWNIGAGVKEIPENSCPRGSMEGMNDSDRTGYIGPCPPSGTHRYFFKVYALDTILDLESSARANDIVASMEGKVLADAQLVGLYKRK